MFTRSPPGDAPGKYTRTVHLVCTHGDSLPLFRIYCVLWDLLCVGLLLNLFHIIAHEIGSKFISLSTGKYGRSALLYKYVLVCAAQEATASGGSAELPIASVDSNILDAVRSVASATKQLVLEATYAHKDVQRRSLVLEPGAGGDAKRRSTGGPDSSSADDERLVWTQGLLQAVRHPSCSILIQSIRIRDFAYFMNLI